LICLLLYFTVKHTSPIKDVL